MLNSAKHNSQSSKKGLSPEAKSNLKLGFSSIISNGACVELGQNHPWYGAILMGLLAVILAIIPIGVTRSWVKAGDNMLATPTYEYETCLKQFLDDVDSKNVSIAVDHDSKTLTSSNFSSLNFDSNTAWYRFQVTDPNTKVTTNKFEVFYTTATDTDFSSFATNVYDLKNPFTLEANQRTVCNYLILGQKAYVGYKYASGATSASAYKGVVSGIYDLTPSFDFKDLTKQDTHGKAYAISEDLATNKPSEISKDQTQNNLTVYQNQIKDTFKQFFNDGFETTKTSQAWIWTGIMAGVYAAFIIFMGLMIFLMTRGKNNPYRIYTFWQTQKMAYWAAPTPAVLAMGLGFAFSSYAIFMFILFFGMRIMWMSMKTLRPQVESK